MKKNLLILIAVTAAFLLICFCPVKAQSLMAESSLGYSVKPVNTAALVMKVGFMSDDAEVNNPHGLYY